MKAAIENHGLHGCGRQAELRFTRSEVESTKAIRLNDSMRSGVLQTFTMILFLTAAFRVTAQQTWGALGNGLSPGLHALQVAGGVPYAGGDFTSPGSFIAQWNGTAWTAVGTSGGPGGPVYALAALYGNLYVGGQFGSANPILKWDGVSWSNIGGATYTYALATGGGKLYAGGDYNFGSGNRILSYDPVTGWVQLGPNGSIPNTVYAIAVTADGSIYAGGRDGTGAAFLCKWNPAGSGSWDAITGGPTGGSSSYAGVYALTAYGNDLYVG